VDETVEMARELGLGPQSGFVNAILRGYAREREATERLLKDLKTSQPALGHSHPEWLYERWRTRWGAEQAARLMDWNNSPPPTYARVNTLKTDAPKLAARWKTEGVEFTPCQWDWLEVQPANAGKGAETLQAQTSSLPLPGERAGVRASVPLHPNTLIFRLDSHAALAGLKSFQDGLFYIQDPSTLLAVRLLDPQPGDTVLDLCAAPGGKTTFIAQLMQNRGQILARDNAPERLELVRENCARLGVTCVVTEAALGQSQIENQKSKIKNILVDAPCSNTGVMRRRVDLRWRVQPAEIGRLQVAQLGLLRQAAEQLQPGGVLVYSTCSLEPEENGAVVQQFLAAHPEFKLEHERELLPFLDGVDGTFVARLKKAG
jgi:16S rRNA (cytosine967-C5)-methyltransferase